MRWIEPRAGVSQYCSRLFTEPCRIGYIGDSVIAQRNGFRPRLHEWLCGHTGQDHTAINACLGSNGGICSVFVMDQLIVKHRPALCFIACSVADMAPYTPAHEVGPVMEGIIRKLADINCPSILLHMYRDDAEAAASSTVIPDQEAIADYYGIPSIHVGRRVREYLGTNDYELSELFLDGIHTTELGAEVCARCITDALESVIVNNPPPTNQGSALLHNVSALPYRHQRSFHHTSIVRCHPSMASDPAAVRSATFRFVYPLLEVPIDTPISFEPPEGEVVGILAVVGRDSGVIEVSTEGMRSTYQLWDHWCYSDRIKAVIFDRPLSGSTPCRIRVLSEAISYGDEPWMRECARVEKRLRIIGFLVRRDAAGDPVEGAR